MFISQHVYDNQYLGIFNFFSILNYNFQLFFMGVGIWRGRFIKNKLGHYFYEYK